MHGKNKRADFVHQLIKSKTYKLVTGRTPFEAFMDDRELIPQFKKVIGGVPEQWIREGLEIGMLAKEPDG